MTLMEGAVVSVHGWRSLRRRAAVQRKDDELARLTARVDRAEAELASRWSWWRQLHTWQLSMCSVDVPSEVAEEAEEDFQKGRIAKQHAEQVVEVSSSPGLEAIEEAEEEEEHADLACEGCSKGCDDWIGCHGIGLDEWEVDLARDVGAALLLAAEKQPFDDAVGKLNTKEHEVFKRGALLITMLVPCFSGELDLKRLVRSVVQTMGPEFKYLMRADDSAEDAATMYKLAAKSLGIQMPDG